MISGSLFFYQNWLTFLLALWLSFLLTKAPIERITVRKKHQQYSTIAVIAKEDHGQMAVLYRNNGSAIPMMDLFLRENIPFNRLKEAGENFFTSKVVQDIVYFLRFAIDLNDSEAFNQVYYKCGYGFNKKTLIPQSS